MYFQQFFEPVSCAFSYLLADEAGREALLIDPVREQVAAYQAVLEKLKVKLALTIDTHTHADHITGAGRLRADNGSLIVMGEQTDVACVDIRCHDGELLRVGELRLRCLHTPGHTQDSYSFLLEMQQAPIVFTGDTLLIGGSGRTDFQQGDARAQYHSLFDKLLTLNDETRVYPGHDYRGQRFSTIGREKRSNPRLQVRDACEYERLMKALKLPRPAQMDVAIPANLQCGMAA